ncbi:MAG: trypsin-like peptidase domain-containing protein [Myxococcaceae bacterium]|nr:trypsin-like peptidase domain-containing protein [Myxococcaceae bacterium]
MKALHPISALCAATVTLALGACATVSPATAPAAAPARAPVSSVDTSAARHERVKALLAHNVRLFLYDGKELKRTASGVVVGSEVGAGGSGTYVLTSAHNLDTRGMKAPEVRVVVDRPWDEGRSEPMEFGAALVAAGDPSEEDLALLKVEGISLEPAPLADDAELVPGDPVLVASAPFGSAISLSGGLISFVDRDPKTGAPAILKTDANVGYGASGGGVYARDSGHLLAIVAGYRTAKLQSFELPLPGETFALPVSTIRTFLERKGFANLARPHALGPRRSAAR